MENVDHGDVGFVAGYLGLALVVGSSSYLRGRSDESPLSIAEYSRQTAEVMPWYVPVALILFAVGMTLMFLAVLILTYFRE